MAKKIKLTRPELKRQRDALARFERYLPMLKLKQQQLQLTLLEVAEKQRAADRAAQQAQRKFDAYRHVLGDRAGLNIEKLASPSQVRTSTTNVAGVAVPVFEGVEFPEAAYSLFGTPAWVDRALADLREVNRRRAEQEVIRRQYERLHQELSRVIQRVNLFEKLMIPQAREAIRRIRIHLGDEMTAAVGRAKIAKAKVSEEETAAAGAEGLGNAFAGQETPAP